MDNLKTLFEKGYYELILKLTNESDDPTYLLFRLLSLVCLNNDQEALKLIDSKQEIFEKSYPEKLIKTHLELLLKNQKFDEAKDALTHYQNLPYISQNVEEMLIDYPKQIEILKDNKNGQVFSEEEIDDILLNSTDGYKISEAVFSLRKMNISIFIDTIKKFIIRKDVHPYYRTFGLLLLVDYKYNENIQFLYNDNLIRINPVNLKPPFMDDKYNLLCEKIYFKTNKNISIQEAALHLLNCYILCIYPNKLNDKKIEEYCDAFISISSDLFHENYPINKETLILKNNIKKTIESVEEILN